MRIAADEASQVENAVIAALGDCAHSVLAVSGGLDSMVLLTAASRLPARARRDITVATFDHGTGKAAGRAAAKNRQKAGKKIVRGITPPGFAQGLRRGFSL